MSYFLDFSILKRNMNFLWLFTGQFISLMGTMITSVALPYQIYKKTHLLYMVGLLSLVQLLPLLVTALIGGVFADRYHRRLLLISAESILSLGCLSLAINSFYFDDNVIVLFIVAFLMSAFNGLHRPALESMVQQIVNKKDYGSVGSLGSMKVSVCMIAGPAIGGLLIAKVGLAYTYLIDFLSFFFSLVCLFMMSHIPKPKAKLDESTWAALKAGLVYAYSRQELMGTYLVDFIAMIFGMPTALFPAIAESFGGASVLGLLYSAPAIGALLVSFVSGWVNKVLYHGRAIAISAMLWGVSIIFFAFSTKFLVAIFFLALAGAFDAISGIFRSMMWNETIPQHIRGRMAGIEMISYLSGPKLGDTEAGFVAQLFGITFSIVSGGVLCVTGVLVLCFYLPKFWAYRCERS